MFTQNVFGYTFIFTQFFHIYNQENYREQFNCTHIHTHKWGNVRRYFVCSYASFLKFSNAKNEKSTRLSIAKSVRVVTYLLLDPPPVINQSHGLLTLVTAFLLNSRPSAIIYSVNLNTINKSNIHKVIVTPRLLYACITWSKTNNSNILNFTTK